MSTWIANRCPGDRRHSHQTGRLAYHEILAEKLKDALRIEHNALRDNAEGMLAPEAC